VSRRSSDDYRSARDIAIIGLAMDVALLVGFVWLYAFDYDTQVWPILFIAPLEGAILFQLRGAMLSWGAISLFYALRDIWAAERWGNPLIWNSITFRMGIAGIIALVAGLMSRDLVRQRAKLSGALAEISRIDRLRSGLVNMLSHDVRSPITVIRGSVETLITRDDTIKKDDRIALLKAADRQAHRLERLANDLLDLARLDSGRLDLATESVDVNELVREALSYIEDSDALTVDVEEGLRVEADPRRLEQVLINLTHNALNHGAPPVTISGKSDNGLVVLEVSDHGEGVPPAALESLFEPFGQAKKPGSNGYGLAIVKALIEAHGGDVSYSANEHGGASFRVALPRSA
jgi:signal transduction histidine kinase